MTLVRDSLQDWPEIWMDVFVVGDKYERAAFAEMFVRGQCQGVDLPEDADVVVFTGGPDVNPIYYGEEPHGTTHFDQNRDNADIEVYRFCLENGIPMLGICRGAQFLHVMNGGRLYQDVDKHNGDHTMWDRKRKKMVKRVSSVHHQMCIENVKGGMEVIGDAFHSSERWLRPDVKETRQMSPDIEAFFYRDTCCFGIQGHPEYRGYTEFAKWTLQTMWELFCENPDIELRDKVRRIKKDLLEQRSENWMKLACAEVVTIN